MGRRFKLRRGTAARWAAANPVLLAGEPGLETDTLKLKHGDGATAWNDLPYWNFGGGGSGEGGTPGAPGKNWREIEIRNSGTDIQWRYTGDTEWTDVIALTDITGPAGKSAYEIAAEADFEGTEDEWLESLKGEPGEKGKDGEGLHIGGTADSLAELPGSAEEGAIWLAGGHLYSWDGEDWLDQGALAGIPGTPGADGTPGTPGMPGADGKSAYEIAADEGFAGTEEEWLASLKGEPGEPGKDGADGKDGKDGKDGEDGAAAELVQTLDGGEADKAPSAAAVAAAIGALSVSSQWEGIEADE